MKKITSFGVMKIHKLVYGPFNENTYILEDVVSKTCIIIDPGMYGPDEQTDFLEVINTNGLTPELLLNTHCHIDHVLGNRFVKDTFDLQPHAHELATKTLEMAVLSAQVYGINYDPSPELITDLEDGEILEFHGHSLKILFTPGHAMGHVVFYNQAENYVIGGDVLFKGSVGRVDLPGCNAKDLETSIREKLYVLPEETVVYPGHGPETTIGEEKRSNFFVNEKESRLS